MQEAVLRKLFLGFIHIHILHHAKQEPFYGAWMMGELSGHGYEISAGTLYPILHGMEKSGLLLVESRTEGGRVRKYYAIAPEGETVLAEAKARIKELAGELHIQVD